jgi:hypothetical protein
MEDEYKMEVSEEDCRDSDSAPPGFPAEGTDAYEDLYWSMVSIIPEPPKIGVKRKELVGLNDPNAW